MSESVPVIPHTNGLTPGNSETDPRKVQDDIVAQWDRWFRHVRREFCPLLLEYAGRPITYVEIGCWAGASAEWVAKNVLTHPASIGVGIDPYLPDKPHHPVQAIRARAHHRLEFMGSRWHWLELRSVIALRMLPERLWQLREDRSQLIDVLYIDGDHSAPGVMQDFAIAWQCLRIGSLVVFDDYRCRRVHHEPHVKDAVDAIVRLWRPLLKPIGRGRRQRAFKIVDYAQSCL